MKSITRWLFFGLFLLLMAKGKPVIWLALFAGSLLAALIWGRIYCGYICPMNTVMIPVQTISEKTGLQRKAIPRWLQTAWLPVWMLILSVVVMVAGRRQGVNVPILPAWLLLAVVVTLFVKSEGFHNGLCPFSTLQKLFSRNSRYAFAVQPDQCIRCQRCVSVCPSGAINMIGVDHTALIKKDLCHQCGSCAKTCPEQAIQYRQ